VLVEEARRIQADEPPLGFKRLDESVDDGVAALSTAFTTWAPGVVGRSDLDPVLNRVPRLIEQVNELSQAVKRGLGMWLTLDDLAAGHQDEDAATEHARQAASHALRAFLVALREFDAERKQYLAAQLRGDVPTSRHR
jgi:hypothetical protein